MGKLVLKNAFIEVDGVDLSCFATEVEVSASKDDVDANTFCGQDKLHGLEESTISVTLLQDFDAAAVDETLWPLYDTEVEFTVVVRPTQDPVSATNPEYSGTCKLLEYTPLSGGVGDVSEVDIEFPVIGALARAIA